MKQMILLGLAVSTLLATDIYKTDDTSVPALKMRDNNLTFKEIEGYQNYKIISTHFRSDKNELRYILANPIAYNALRADKTPLPNGSKVVKIGWSVKKMDTFNSALEADKIQRVEYMIKDDSKYNHTGDHWGYARFVKKDGEYEAWEKGVGGCIACHAQVKGDDYLFTHFQKVF